MANTMVPLVVMLVIAVSSVLGASVIGENRISKDWPKPPPWTEKAQMARYLVHSGIWGIISALSPDFGYVPFGTVQSFADGTTNQSSGIPYFYIASISDTYKNVHYNNTVSLSISQAESNHCSEQELDPEEPTCARITLVGKMVVVTDAKESGFAKQALFERHPAMKGWPTGHDWNFYKLAPTAICLLDFYGGATHLPLKDYFAAKP